VRQVLQELLRIEDAGLQGLRCGRQRDRLQDLPRGECVKFEKAGDLRRGVCVSE
jgi:hypothetical protein